VNSSRTSQRPFLVVLWQELLELMIPPHYRLGSTVVVRPSRFGVVPGSIPGLAILFSSYRSPFEKRSHKDTLHFNT
jgi:hypothetical protein